MSYHIRQLPVEDNIKITLNQLSSQNPGVCFPRDVSGLDLTPYGAAIVFEVPRPAINERTQKVDELTPQENNGMLFQRWQIRDATAEEVDEFDARNPRWNEFAVALQQLPNVTELINSVPLPIALHLAIGLSQASQGDPRPFAQAMGLARARGLVTEAFITAVSELVLQFRLPGSFLEIVLG